MNISPRYFTGEFEHSIDAVNRLVIPAKWRTGESEEIFLFAEKGRVAVLPKAELDKILQGIETAPALSAHEKSQRSQDLFRRFEQVTCDRQGRITIPDKVLKQSGIKGRVILAGRGYRFNIWDPMIFERWKKDYEAAGVAGIKEFGI